MTKITFYFNAASKPVTAFRLAGKAHAQGLKVLVYTDDAAQEAALDQLFWTTEQLAFLPHVRCGHPAAAETPVLIGRDADALARADVLINLAAEPPAFFARFDRVLDIVGTDETDRARGRVRYKHFKERGYAVEHHDLTAPR